MNAAQYADNASTIFVLSDSFTRIKELIDDESSTIDDISDVVLLDPALSATILKLANSSFFNYPGKIDTISKAVLVLGITEVYNLVIAHFTAEAFSKIEADSEFLDLFWLKSVDCALIITFLGRELNITNPERLFILGLLHNIGELVVRQLNQEKAVECESDDIALLPWQKQLEVLGFSYGDCSAELMKLWQLPYSLFAPIRNQDQDDLEHANIDTQLLYVAKRMMTCNITMKKSQYTDLIDEALLTSLGIDQDMLIAARNFCDLERLGMLSILCPGADMIY